MGTNYYAYFVDSADKPAYHIGKRSAAGYFCSKCGISYINKVKNVSGNTIYGNDAVHFVDTIEPRRDFYNEPNLLNRCPICDRSVSKTRPVCSFTFGVSPYILSCIMNYSNIIIKNEYNELLSKRGFKKILQDCCLKYFHLVNKEFF